MTNNYEMELMKVVNQAQRDIMYKAMDEIDAKRTQITDLLEKGREYYQQAYGDRFQRIYELRQKLWLKVEVYNKSIDCMWETLRAIN